MRTSPHTHPNDVYFNLHNSLWSVVARSTGRVAKHMNELIMLDVCFVVRPKGNAKVRSEKVKNVHAFVRGSAIDETPAVRELAPGLYEGPWTQIRYNPYEHTSFMAVTPEGEKPVTTASIVRMTSDRKVWAVLPQ
jgi:hypothetical protein